MPFFFLVRTILRRFQPHDPELLSGAIPRPASRIVDHSEFILYSGGLTNALTYSGGLPGQKDKIPLGRFVNHG
jgi:hypothetical protein